MRIRTRSKVQFTTKVNNTQIRAIEKENKNKNKNKNHG
jgi:hypothetical protein